MAGARANIAAFYDAVAVSFDRDYYGADADPCIAWDVRWFESLLEGVLATERPTTALEIGCGTGHWLAWLDGRGVSACGIDVSERMCAEAKRRGVSAVQAGAARLPFDSGTFDLVISPYCALDHEPDFITAFQEIGRVARTRATAVIMLDNAHRLIRWYWHVESARVRSVGEKSEEPGTWQHEVDERLVTVFTKRFSVEEVTRLLAEWQVETVGVGLLTPLVPRILRRRARRATKLLLRAIGPLERRACRRYPDRAALCVYVARR